MKGLRTSCEGEEVEEEGEGEVGMLGRGAASEESQHEEVLWLVPFLAAADRAKEGEAHGEV